MTALSILTKTAGLIGAASVALVVSTSAFASHGTKCRAPGNCWEPKLGFPDKVAGSKYDPKHDPAQLAKNSQAISDMEARNAKRVENFKKTGKWVYDVSKL